MRIKIISIVVTITGITLLFVFSDRVYKQDQATANNKNQILSENTIKQTVSVVKQQKTQIAVNSIAIKQQQTNRLISGYQTLWQVANNKNDKPFPFKNPRKIKYRHLILNNIIISRLKPGDEFTFFIPQSEQHYYGVITQAKLTDSGVNSYYGTLKDHSRQFSFSITQGPNDTYARFNTPEGLYILESYSGETWISDTRDERISLDYSKTDVVNLTTSQY